MDKLLIIDDDQELCELLTDFLAMDGFTVCAIHDGSKGVDHLRSTTYDAIVLDIMLPGMQGLDVLRSVRKFCDTPIIMLTARGEDTDRILGLELGADDYLPKPCNPRELSARLRAILRRVHTDPGASDADVLTVGETVLDLASRTASHAECELNLTAAEFGLLRLLLKESGKIVSKETLCREVLGRELTPYDRSIDVHVSKLRKKLATAGGENLIVSIRGAGYQFKRMPVAH